VWTPTAWFADHSETFGGESARLRNGEGLPRFVGEECRAFLRLGIGASGITLSGMGAPFRR